MADSAHHDPHGDGTYGEVFDDAHPDTRQQQTVHRIRANSSIMQLKKILGTSNSSSYPAIELRQVRALLLMTFFAPLQLPIEEKSVSIITLPPICGFLLGAPTNSYPAIRVRTLPRSLRS